MNDIQNIIYMSTLPIFSNNDISGTFPINTVATKNKKHKPNTCGTISFIKHVNPAPASNKIFKNANPQG